MQLRARRLKKPQAKPRRQEALSPAALDLGLGSPPLTDEQFQDALFCAKVAAVIERLALEQASADLRRLVFMRAEQIGKEAAKQATLKLASSRWAKRIVQGLLVRPPKDGRPAVGAPKTQALDDLRWATLYEIWRTQNPKGKATVDDFLEWRRTVFLKQSKPSVALLANDKIRFERAQSRSKKYPALAKG